MTKYTQDQLLAMTNEQLDEIVALAQGWVLVHGVWWESLYIHADVFPNYHPTQDSESGRSQAFQLQIKFNLLVNVRKYFTKVAWDGMSDSDLVEVHDTQLAICYAVILSQLEGYEL